ncbi:hypothetical protein [Dyella silvatica]|uniref:hypothetical protein n=1 Tax=Dyella silvatica TaxID=2992128 RepID=UPI0022574364|nr:hypothetical protein [Dyella silvatica]
MQNILERPISLIARATAVAGTLDILSAGIYMVMAGRNPWVAPISIASAIWPGAQKAGVAAILVGLLLHFAIMLVMVSVFVAIAQRMRWIAVQPMAAGALYGLLLWAVMNLIVLPLRWPALFPHFTSQSLAEQLFSHIVLVGIAMAWMTSKAMRPG